MGVNLSICKFFGISHDVNIVIDMQTYGSDQEVIKRAVIPEDLERAYLTYLSSFNASAESHDNAPTFVKAGAASKGWPSKTLAVCFIIQVLMM